MIKQYCDKCKAETSQLNEVRQFEEYQYYKYSGYKLGDFCDNCFIALKQWMKGN